jgi:hypothetical protein
MIAVEEKPTMMSNIRNASLEGTIAAGAYQDYTISSYKQHVHFPFRYLYNRRASVVSPEKGRWALTFTVVDPSGAPSACSTIIMVSSTSLNMRFICPSYAFKSANQESIMISAVSAYRNEGRGMQ